METIFDIIPTPSNLRKIPTDIFEEHQKSISVEFLNKLKDTMICSRRANFNFATCRIPKDMTSKTKENIITGLKDGGYEASFEYDSDSDSDVCLMRVEW